MISKDYVTFFKGLEKNNHRDWFQEHKSDYENHVKKPFIALLDSLIPEVSKLEPDISPNPKDAIFRINRDIRFSKDKTPYNTIMKAGFSAGGKKSQLPGYYLGIDANRIHAGGGLFNLDTKSLKNVRELIADDPKAFTRIINGKAFTNKFGGLKGEQAKRLDKALQPVLDQTPYIANKQFYAMADILLKDYLGSAKIQKLVLDHFKEISKLNNYLKQAVFMKQFLILLKSKGELDYSPEKLEERIQEYRTWVKEIQEYYVGDNRLEQTGTHIPEKGIVKTDGPFLESKEMIAGYVILQADSLEKATEVADTSPLLQYFEIYVRPIAPVL